MKKYKIKNGFIYQKLGNKTVIFDGEKSVLYTFNEIASFMFSKLKLGWEKKRIIEQIVTKYEVENDEVDKDFSQLILDLKKKKILA